MTTTNELELLRKTLSLDHTLFTVQRNAIRPLDSIRVDCFASKGMGSPGLKRITGLVADVLDYRKGPRGLILNKEDEADHNLVVALSKKLEIDLKHERVN